MAHENNLQNLIDLLQTGDDAQRATAVRALCDSGDERAIQPLIDTLRNDASLKVRVLIAREIGCFCDARVAAALLDILAAKGVGRYAAHSLRDNPCLGHLIVVRLLQELSSADTTEDRDMICAQLDQIDSPHTLPLYLDRLDDKNAQLAALARLSRLLPEIRERKILDQTRMRLLELLNAAVEPAVRAAVAEALGALAPSGQEERLAQLIRDDEALVVRVAAICALGRLEPQGKLDRLRAGVGPADDPQVLRAMMTVLAAWQYVPRPARRYARELLQTLSDRAPEDAEAARQTLVALGLDPAYRDATCVQCGRGQDDAPLMTCDRCGKTVCEDHMLRQPGGDRVYCSDSCRHDNRPSNPQYW